MKQIEHGQYKINLCDNGDIQIEHKGSQIVWVDNHYMDADNVPDGAEHQKGLPSVIVNAVNQDEPSVCLSVGDDKVYVNDIDWEITEDKRGVTMSAKNYIKAAKGEQGKGTTDTVEGKAAGALNIKELQEAALKDIQKRYEQDGQSAAIKLAYLKYPMLGVTTFCMGCECETLFIDDQCCLCGGAMPKPPKEYFIKFVADDDYTHFAKLSHATKTEKQLEADWDKAVKKAKKKGFDWNHSDALLEMQDMGWKHEPLNTVQLDY